MHLLAARWLFCYLSIFFLIGCLKHFLVTAKEMAEVWGQVQLHKCILAPQMWGGVRNWKWSPACIDPIDVSNLDFCGPNTWLYQSSILQSHPSIPWQKISTFPCIQSWAQSFQHTEKCHLNGLATVLNKVPYHFIMLKYMFKQVYVLKCCLSPREGYRFFFFSKKATDTYF